jgi:mitogen-activated protein kinase kinase kinase 7
VANGHREDLPHYWPFALKDLVASCWAQDPASRPSFAQVLDMLYQLKLTGAVEHMDDRRPKGEYNPVNDCGCAIM